VCIFGVDIVVVRYYPGGIDRLINCFFMMQDVYNPRGGPVLMLRNPTKHDEPHEAWWLASHTVDSTTPRQLHVSGSECG
jgi:hypothetical protein